MRIKQIGNGGGLDPLATNSSFLIELKKDSYLLFDCGSNVIQKLIELDEDESEIFKIKHIQYVFISHIHDDHAGSLETLIFYNYFKNNVKMTILFANKKTGAFLELKIPTEIFAGCQSVYNQFTNRVVSLEFSGLALTGEVKASALNKTYHGVIPSSGLVLKHEEEAIVITGDTKASSLIEDEIKKEIEDIDKCLVFHDYSFWNCPSKNVHACESDFEAEYSESFKQQVGKYHTGKGLCVTTWQEVPKWRR